MDWVDWLKSRSSVPAGSNSRAEKIGIHDEHLYIQRPGEGEIVDDTIGIGWGKVKKLNGVKRWFLRAI